MKMNKSILVAAIAVLGLAACENKTTEPTQADIDKEVAVKVMAISSQLQADCDERLMTEANRLADSLFLVKGKAKPAPAPAKAPTPKVIKTTPKETTPIKETPTVPSNTTRPGSNQGQNVPANNTSRPGSDQGTQKAAPAGNTTRPGANK